MEDIGSDVHRQSVHLNHLRESIYRHRFNGLLAQLHKLQRVAMDVLGIISRRIDLRFRIHAVNE